VLFRHHASGRDELPPMSMGAKRRCLPQTTCSRCKFSSQCLLWRRSTAKLITARWVRASSTDGEPTTTSTNLAGNFPSLHPRRPKPKPKPVSVCGVADTCSRDAAAGALPAEIKIIIIIVIIVTAPLLTSSILRFMLFFLLCLLFFFFMILLFIIIIVIIVVVVVCS